MQGPWGGWQDGSVQGTEIRILQDYERQDNNSGFFFPKGNGKQSESFIQRHNVTWIRDFINLDVKTYL